MNNQFGSLTNEASGVLSISSAGAPPAAGTSVQPGLSAAVSFPHAPPPGHPRLVESNPSYRIQPPPSQSMQQPSSGNFSYRVPPNPQPPPSGYEHYRGGPPPGGRTNWSVKRRPMQGFHPGQSGQTPQEQYARIKVQEEAQKEQVRKQQKQREEAREAQQFQQEHEHDGMAEGDTFATYVPSKLRIGNPHPDVCVETATMSSVEPPNITYQLHLPQEVIDNVYLSSLQLEAVVYACQSHEKLLPNGDRQGYLIGDGAGVGKGRTIAGIIFENYLQGRKRAVWLSVSADLIHDAERDLDDVDAPASIEVRTITDFAYGWPLSSNTNANEKGRRFEEGVLYSTYSSLIASSSTCKNKHKRRLDQIVDWCGGLDFDGLLIFDECHRAKHLVQIGKTKTATKTAQAVFDIQQKLPKARVVYASATGASEIRNTAFMTRLGLWGQGCLYEEFKSFCSAIEARGVAGLEVTAMELKLRGLYCARQLSFTGASFDITEMPVDEEFIKLYNDCVDFWCRSRDAFEKAADEFAAPNKMKNMMWAQFYGAQQRFFKYLCLSVKAPFVAKLAKDAVEAGKCAVIGLQSTGEARTREEMENRGDEIDDFVSTARATFDSLLDTQFPGVRSMIRVSDEVRKEENNDEPLPRHRRAKLAAQDALAGKSGSGGPSNGGESNFLDSALERLRARRDKLKAEAGGKDQMHNARGSRSNSTANSIKSEADGGGDAFSWTRSRSKSPSASVASTTDSSATKKKRGRPVRKRIPASSESSNSTIRGSRRKRPQHTGRGRRGSPSSLQKRIKLEDNMSEIEEKTEGDEDEVKPRKTRGNRISYHDNEDDTDDADQQPSTSAAAVRRATASSSTRIADLRGGGPRGRPPAKSLVPKSAPMLTRRGKTADDCIEISDDDGDDAESSVAPTQAFAQKEKSSSTRGNSTKSSRINGNARDGRRRDVETDEDVEVDNEPPPPPVTNGRQRPQRQQKLKAMEAIKRSAVISGLAASSSRRRVGSDSGSDTAEASNKNHRSPPKRARVGEVAKVVSKTVAVKNRIVRLPENEQNAGSESDNGSSPSNAAETEDDDPFGLLVGIERPEKSTSTSAQKKKLADEDVAKSRNDERQTLAGSASTTRSDKPVVKRTTFFSEQAEKKNETTLKSRNSRAATSADVDRNDQSSGDSDAEANDDYDDTAEVKTTIRRATRRSNADGQMEKDEGLHSNTADKRKIDDDTVKRIAVEVAARVGTSSRRGAAKSRMRANLKGRKKNRDFASDDGNSKSDVDDNSEDSDFELDEDDEEVIAAAKPKKVAALKTKPKKSATETDAVRNGGTDDDDDISSAVPSTAPASVQTVSSSTGTTSSGGYRPWDLVDENYNRFAGSDDDDDEDGKPDPWMVCLKKKRQAYKEALQAKQAIEAIPDFKPNGVAKKPADYDDDEDDGEDEDNDGLLYGHEADASVVKPPKIDKSTLPGKAEWELATTLYRDLKKEFAEKLGPRLPPNPLDFLIDELGGPSKVAELTGRKIRIARGDDGAIRCAKRNVDDDTKLDQMNMVEKRRFMDGEKLIAVISEAASSGISLQADRRVLNKRRRVHLTLELPWAAESAVQQFGRTHRSNQVSAPEYVLITSGICGEHRFAASVAKRLNMLGALTRGDRRAADASDLTEFNVDTKYGRKALNHVLKVALGVEQPKDTEALREYEGIDADTSDYSGTSRFVSDMRRAFIRACIFKGNEVYDVLRREDFVDKMISIPRFLNRLMCMHVRVQNVVFEYLNFTMETLLGAARAEGKLDNGIMELGSDSHDVKLEKRTVMKMTAADGTTAKKDHSDRTLLVSLNEVSLNRGLTWEQASEMLNSYKARQAEDPEAAKKDRSGFYLSVPHRLLNKYLVSLGLRCANQRHVHPSFRRYTMYKPNIGLAKQETYTDLSSKAKQAVTDKELAIAERTWKEIYEKTGQNCLHKYWDNKCMATMRGVACDFGQRECRYHVLTGSLLTIMSDLEYSVGTDETKRMLKLVRVRTSDEQRLVGMYVPRHHLDHVIKILRLKEVNSAGMIKGEYLATMPLLIKHDPLPSLPSLPSAVADVGSVMPPINIAPLVSMPKPEVVQVKSEI